MKELISIVENNLGADYVTHASYKLNNVHYIVYKEYDGMRSVVMKIMPLLVQFLTILLKQILG